jgi:hypothetical protein
VELGVNGNGSSLLGLKLVPIVDLNLVTECGEQVFPVIGYALTSTHSPIAKVYKRWNVNGKVGIV